MDLKDKVAVVTGGASGLGRATVEVFLAKGAKVVIFDLNEVAGQRAAEELGDHCSFEVVNVADEASAKTAIQNVLSTHGREKINRSFLHCLDYGRCITVGRKKDYRHTVLGTG